ncbi:hypothetical protein DFLDMN_006262 (plasmid) [Cupriavidus sp. H19C3]
MGSQRNSHLYRNEAIRLFLYNRKAYDSESAVSWHDPYNALMVISAMLREALEGVNLASSYQIAYAS